MGTGPSVLSEPPALDADRVAERLALVRDRIAQAGGLPGSVTVVAVTKGFGPAAVSAAAGAGLYDIGENYAQEMLSKIGAAPVGVRWHFLGELQRNKLARLAPHVYLWQGLDTPAGADALAKRCPGAAVLVEVKLADGDHRHGVAPPDVPALVGHAVDAGLDVRGLMAVGSPRSPREEVRASFRAVAVLASSLGLSQLSMGMSADYELAVAEGATMVRLGTALFGRRPRADVPCHGVTGLG
jgi:pyridoxal phosphate enzyme (YggS family)